MIEELTLYEAAGGMPFFEGLVGRFYESVATDPVLRPLYPEADLEGARHRLTLFLAQYWGGPRTYDAERGHPRLRMRHMPFAIGPAERDAWLRLMRAAIDGSGASTTVTQRLQVYIDSAAEAMRNRDWSGPPTAEVDRVDWGQAERAREVSIGRRRGRGGQGSIDR